MGIFEIVGVFVMIVGIWNWYVVFGVGVLFVVFMVGVVYVYMV